MPQVGTVALIMSLFLILTLGITASLQQPVPQPAPVVSAPVVVVDAGHGGHDPGAVVAGVLEKHINLALALRVQRKAHSMGNIQVILTRTSDVYPTLLERVRLAEAVGAQLYLSIHGNYFRDPRVCGVETLVDTTAHAESLRLAREVQRALVAATGARDRGVRRQALYLRHTSLPSALVEVGFLTCPGDRAKLLDPAYQERIAAAILRGILAFLQAP